MKIKGFNRIYRRMLFTVVAVLTLLVALFFFLLFLIFRTSFLNVDVISENTSLIVTCSVISLLIAGQALAIYWSRRVTKPVEEISEKVAEVAQGNFDVHIDTSKFKHEIKEMAEDFNKMIEELKSIETMRADFVFSVSHEFRTPLSVIQGYVTLLSNPELTYEQQKNYLDKLVESTQQLSGLVDNVLKLSKLESQNIVSKIEKFSLDEQLRLAVLMFEQQWTEKNIELDLDLPQCEYEGNVEMINQIWVNLLGNAMKYTGENGKISVKLDDSQTDFISVSISDTGIGMTEEVKNHIFEKFYQADTSRKSEGSGLGLALVQTIANLTKCTVLVESEPQQGSTFTVKMPKS